MKKTPVFQSTMRPSNLLKIFAEADLLGEADLRKLAKNRIAWNFCSTVSADSNFLSELSVELLKEIVDHPGTNVIKLFSAVIYKSL
jgi:hypothetical protein